MPQRPPAPPGRRAFLKTAGRALVGLAFVPLAGCDENTVTPRIEGGAVPFLTSPEIPEAQGGLYVENGAEGAVPGWAMPDLDPAAWRLQVDGLVATPLALTLAELEAEAAGTLPVLKTLRCITDTNAFPGLTGTTLWRGVPLRAVLDRAGLDRGRARRLRLYGADGFTNNLRVEAVYGPFAPGFYEPLLVTEMGGRPLERDHGAPVRLMVFDGYGYQSVKWLVRIEATSNDDAFGTYQQVLGFDDGVTMQAASKVTDPVEAQVLPAGATLIQGFAVSGLAAIARVEVSIDGAPFAPAALVSFEEIAAAHPAVAGAQQVADGLAYPFPAVWTPWQFRWDAAPGTHTLRVRAVDAAGNTQPDRDPAFEDGLNPVAEVTVTVA